MYVKLLLLVFSALASFLFTRNILLEAAPDSENTSSINETFWKVQCIDTMKLSRDNARAWNKKSDLDQIIDRQMELIKEIGANCVAIGTPYDEEFVPFLTHWLTSARE